MRKIGLSVAAFGSLLLVPAGAVAQPAAASADKPEAASAPIEASFDCTKARGTAEKLICSDADLARRDRALAALYRRALAKASDRDAVAAEQADWVALSRNACRSRACLVHAYASRARELRDWIGP